MEPAPPLVETKDLLAGGVYTSMSYAGVTNVWGTPGRADGWDLERVIIEGYERSIWTFKSMEAISKHASTLPVQIGHGGDEREFEEVLEDHPLLKLLNKQANSLETGDVFKKRLSAMLLLCKNGVFIQKTKSRGGVLTQLDLLAPDRVQIVPDNENATYGEADLRFAALLEDEQRRRELPEVLWRDPLLGTTGMGTADARTKARMLGPDINSLPYVDRAFLPQDPYRAAPSVTDRRLAACRGSEWLAAAAVDGHVEANIVGSRGCPYNCGFCGAAWSANPDVKIRVRSAENIIGELDMLHDEHGVTAFRFVDDLFLGVRDVIYEHMKTFADHRINVLDRLKDHDLDVLVANGLREVALGIESGSNRMLQAMDKRITTEMTERVTRRLLERGIGVKGYFILGYPGETRDDLDATVRHIRKLWDIADRSPGGLRASVFEFRPYPGTPVWKALTEDSG
ncbi:phage portal protein [Streptomyces sp. NPDC002671]